MNKGTYKNGTETRNKIKNAAKRLFYRYGVQNVSVADICREVNIAYGNFTYYYPTKMELIQDILRSFQMECESYASGILPEDSSLLFKSCVISEVLVISLSKNEKVSRFLLDVYENPKFSHLIRNLLTVNYEGILSAKDESFSSKNLLYSISADTHIKLGLFRDLMLRTSFHPTIEQVTECADVMFELFGKVFSFSSDEIEEALTAARAILKLCRIETLPYLI